MAEQLGAAPRAVYRDLDVLQDLPVPLYTEKNGRESFWKIDPDYKSKLSIPFSLSELLSLYFTQDSIRSLDGTVLYDSLQSLFEKVWAILPKPLFREMVGLSKSFLSGIPAQKNYGDYREFIKVIQQAIEGRKVLQLLYHPRDQSPAERRVNPYAVHLHNGSLYVIGHCHLRKDIRCSLTDLAGALYVDAALPRKSCVEFGWVVGLPSDADGQPLTTTEQYFHVKFAAERGGAAGEESTVGKQPIFHRPASSGIYALICNLDLYRLGLNDITRAYVVGRADRIARAKAVVHALAATLIKPAGAQRNTQNPHIVNCEGVVAVSSTSLPAPTVSPLNDNYREQITQTATVLNSIRSGGVGVQQFETLADGVGVLAGIAAELDLPGA